jgi:hypothetical protein
LPRLLIAAVHLQAQAIDYSALDERLGRISSMKYLFALLASLACAQALADTYTLVIRTEIDVPGANQTWNQQPVNLASMSGLFYVGPFADLSLCQAYKANGVTGMFAGSTFNGLPVGVSISTLRCEATSALP